ncbi:hypothetical protein NC651_017415 [Populus alba x Populus x berolinensis]|nr:hypothetical protein NC651_017415 [Populus alba x Populus x berolinensis]
MLRAVGFLELQFVLLILGAAFLQDVGYGKAEKRGNWCCSHCRRWNRLDQLQKMVLCMTEKSSESLLILIFSFTFS